MAKAAQHTALQAVEPAGALARLPDFIANYEGAGAENIDTSRVRPAQLKICQGQSRERKKAEDRYIEGLEEPNLFNSATKEIYGDGPLEFVVIKTLGERALEFDAQFNVVDRDVSVARRNGKYVDPRLNWDDTKQGKDAKPVATVFREYLILLLNTTLAPEMVTISFKGTGLRAAEDLDRLLAYPLKFGDRLVLKPPTFARIFTLSTTTDKKDGNTFSVFRLSQKGKVEGELGTFAAGLYETYRNKIIDIDVEDVDRHNDAPAASSAPVAGSIPF